jgi:hypothetical protein
VNATVDISDTVRGSRCHANSIRTQSIKAGGLEQISHSTALSAALRHEICSARERLVVSGRHMVRFTPKKLIIKA